MATLKGQNFRIYVGTSVVGKSTGCSATLNGNADDSTHKDITGIASAPTIVSKSWSVQVDSLEVCDAATLLKAIKSMTPFTVMWDESSTTNNQTALKATFARRGQAYLSDVTFNWNDRENSTKSLQFSGTGPLEKLTSTPTTEVIAADINYTKGQFVRLFLSSNNTTAPSKVIAAAKQLSLHVSMTLEDATTKDTEGDWVVQEPTQLSYDISSTALMRSGETVTSSVAGKTLANIEDIYESSEPVKFAIAYVTGTNQRTKLVELVQGSVIVSTLTLNGPNRQNADYTTQLTGVGDYTPVADMHKGTFVPDTVSGLGDYMLGPIRVSEGQDLETLPYSGQFQVGDGLGLWSTPDQALVVDFADGIQQWACEDTGEYYIIQKVNDDQDKLKTIPYWIYV